MKRTLDDLNERGANRLIGWIKGTMDQPDAEGRAVKRMVEEFLAFTEKHDARIFREPEAAQAVAA
ncbi:MAG: hypothetical protein ABMA13_23450 [Chthoniobacteraceae bacterium]